MKRGREIVAPLHVSGFVCDERAKLLGLQRIEDVRGQEQNGSEHPEYAGLDARRRYTHGHG